MKAECRLTLHFIIFVTECLLSVILNLNVRSFNTVQDKVELCSKNNLETQLQSNFVHKVIRIRQIKYVMNYELSD